MSIQKELYDAKIMNLLLDADLPEWANYLVTNDDLAVFVLKTEPEYNENWNRWFIQQHDIMRRKKYRDSGQIIQNIGYISEGNHLYAPATLLDLNRFLFDKL